MDVAQRHYYEFILCLLEDIAEAECQQPVDMQKINLGCRILGRDNTMFMWNTKAELDINFFSCEPEKPTVE
jgi:hypothetical protein